jgi:hypothetical protein
VVRQSGAQPERVLRVFPGIFETGLGAGLVFPGIVVVLGHHVGSFRLLRKVVQALRVGERGNRIIPRALGGVLFPNLGQFTTSIPIRAAHHPQALAQPHVLRVQLKGPFVIGFCEALGVEIDPVPLEELPRHPEITGCFLQQDRVIAFVQLFPDLAGVGPARVLHAD